MKKSISLLLIVLLILLSLCACETDKGTAHSDFSETGTGETLSVSSADYPELKELKSADFSEDIFFTISRHHCFL